MGTGSFLLEVFNHGFCYQASLIVDFGIARLLHTVGWEEVAKDLMTVCIIRHVIHAVIRTSVFFFQNLATKLLDDYMLLVTVAYMRRRFLYTKRNPSTFEEMNSKVCPNNNRTTEWSPRSDRDRGFPLLKSTAL